MADVTTSSNETVYGYFSSESAAEAAVRELQAAGFTRNQISIAGQPESDWDDDSGRPSRNVDAITGTESSAHPAYHEGHKLGEKAGGFWQRVKEMFEGDSAEPYADERGRGDLATHEITDTYAYDPSEFHQSWASTNSSDEYPRRLTERWERTGEGVLVSVNAGFRRSEAENILESNGADLGRNTVDTDLTDRKGDRFATATPTTTSTFASDTTQPTTVADDYDADDVAANTSLGVGAPLGTTRDASVDYADAAEADRLDRTPSRFDRVSEKTPQRVQLYGEVLRVHRDRIQRGEVRVRKEIVTETQTIQVPVSREEIVLERVPVEGDQSAPGVRLGEESEIRVPLSEDRVTIEREPVVREEVEIGKREVTKVESREEPVRREEIVVDDNNDLRRAS